MKTECKTVIGFAIVQQSCREQVLNVSYFHDVIYEQLIQNAFRN